MTYKEYTSRCRRLKAEQSALDRRFIEEYPHRNLFGMNVSVRYRFRGKVHLENFFFEGLEPFFRDVIPVFRFLKENGEPSNRRVPQIYSLNQIEEINPQQQ